MGAGRIQRKRMELQARDDTRPGQVLLLAMLAAAPIALAFVLMPVMTGGTSRDVIRLALFATPVLAAWSLAVFVRAPEGPRRHNAARAGLALALTSLLLGVLILVPALMGRV